MDTTIGAHRGAGDPSLLQDSSAITESATQQDVATVAVTSNQGAASAQPASTTTSGLPPMMTTPDHPLVLTTSDHPPLMATSENPSANATSIQAAATPSHQTHSNQPDISLIFQTLLGRIDELARGTASRLDDLAHSQIACNNRINELQTVEFGASKSRQIDIIPQLQRTLFDDLPTPNTGLGQQPLTQVNNVPTSVTGPRLDRSNHLDDQQAQVTSYPQIASREIRHRDEEIEEMRAQLAHMNSRVHQAISAAPEIDRVLRETQNTPFSLRLLSIHVRHPKKIKLPTYNGTSDPKEYLTAFSIAVGRANFSPEERDAGLCQLFVENLSGVALNWFSRLEANSIDNYNQLSTAFLKHYSIYIQQSTSNADLWTLAQEPTESLRSFFAKFRAIVSRITVLDEAAVLALRNGFWHESKFRKELMKNKPPTLEDALHRANTFIEIEEDNAAFAKKYAATKKSSSKDKETGEHHEPRQHYDQAYKDSKNRRGSNYHVSDQASNRSTGRPARDDGRSKEAQAYCSYHKSKTHTTEECRHLQEYLLTKYNRDRDSSLKDQQNVSAPKNEGERFRLVKEERDRQQGQKRPNEQPNADMEAQKRTCNDRDNEQKRERTPPPRRVINVIMGGLQTCKDSVRSIKEYERRTLTSQKWGTSSSIEAKKAENYEISFTEEDTTGLDKPHNDPLVVELRIGDCEVTRVLVDT